MQSVKQGCYDTTVRGMVSTAHKISSIPHVAFKIGSELLIESHFPLLFPDGKFKKICSLLSKQIAIIAGVFIGQITSKISSSIA